MPIILIIGYDLGTQVFRASVLSKTIINNERRWRTLLTNIHLVVVELDRYEGDMMQAVAESYRYLTSNGIAQGAK